MIRRPLRRRVLTLPLILVLLVLFRAGPVYAHALLLRSDPAQDALLPHSPRVIHLWFSENLGPGASRIVVWNRYRRPVSLGQATVVPGKPRQLEVRVQTLPAGTYLVLWTSVSADDGHILRGFYLFSVKMRGPGPSLRGLPQGTSEGFPDAPTLAGLLAHWIELLAAVTWVGAAMFSVIVLRPVSLGIDEEARLTEQRRARRLIAGSLATLFVASAVLIVDQMYMYAGNNWGSAFAATTIGEVFGAQYGWLWLARQAIVLALLWYFFHPFIRNASRGDRRPIASARLAIANRHDGIRRGVDDSRPTEGSFRISRRFGQNLLLALGFIYLYLFAASGHAASAGIGVVAGSSILSIAVLLDWIHFLADAAWFGGQIYIVLVLIPALRLRDSPAHVGAFLHAIDRFSPVAYASVGGYIVSGAFAAKLHIPSWYAFFQSVYGRTLIIKVVLVGLMLLVSAGTVFLVRPRLRGQGIVGGEQVTPVATFHLRRLVKWLRVNPVLGAGVLLATSILFYYPVPAGFAPAGPLAYTARANGLTARLTITPDRSGPNTLTVVLRDAQGRPVQHATVRVLTNMLEMVMGVGVTVLDESVPGRYSGTTDLGMGGRWRLTLVVRRPAVTRLNVDVEVGS